MLQLTLMETDEPRGLSALLDDMSAKWSVHLAASPHLREARRVTMARFGSWGGRTLDTGERRRVEAYFNAVIRRRIMKAPDPAARSARKRLMTVAIVNDLREAGWSAARAEEEAMRVTGASVVGAA